jgi:hypothetical protein
LALKERQRLDAKEKADRDREQKAKDAKAKASGKGAAKSPLEKLSGEQKMKVGMMGDALRSLGQYEAAYKAGSRRSRINPETTLLGSFVNDSPIDEATTKLSDDIGRLRSGGAINQDEEARFLKMLPTPADDDATAYRKLANMRTEFQNKLSVFGISEKDLSATGFKFNAEPKKKAMSFEEWKAAGKPKR